MVFTRFVEVGRVCVINYGAGSGKLCVIVNIVDGNRVLVDGPLPLTGVHRQVINIKRLSLTDIKVAIGVHSKEKTIKKAYKEADVLAKFAESNMGKKLAIRAKREAMNDFERFKLQRAKSIRAKAARKKLVELRK